MANIPELKIFKASAGSGKTHTIAKEFLKFTLTGQNPFAFSKVLAVTFTNKAAEEMKMRVIEALNDLIEHGKKSSFYDPVFDAWDDDTLRNKALELRTAILHAYTFLSISTIDSFIQRVIRSFAYDLHLPASYDIQLDTSAVGSDVYDIFMEKLADSEESNSYFSLRHWLETLLMEQINEKGVWSIRQSIESMTQNVFKEEFAEIWENYGKQGFNEKSLQALKQKIDTVIKEFEQQAEVFQQKAEEYANPGFDISRTALKLITGYISEGKYYKPLDKATALKYLDGSGPLLKKKPTPEMSDFLEQKGAEFRQFVDEFMEFLEQNKRRYYTAKVIKEHFYLLAIYADILKALNEYRLRNNKYFIVDLTLLLRKIVKHDDAPFIYEKIGQYYKNILIDEFQDTSHFQWEDFKPLISESLSTGNDSMIVGDVKQAIYRWRNGDWRLLLTGVEQEFPNYAKPYMQGPSTNWRSERNIVEFNNFMFERLPEIIQNLYNNDTGSQEDTIIRAYSDAQQKVSPSKADKYGRVELRFYDKNIDVIQELIDTVIKLKEQGYNYSDIAILVRKNSEAAAIANELAAFRSQNPQYDFSILSNESLLLSNSAVIRLLVNTLEYINMPGDYYLRKVVYEKLVLDNNTRELSQVFLLETGELTEKYLPGFQDFIDRIKGKTLYDLVQQVITYFNLGQYKDQYAYLRTFEDVVLDYMYSNGSDLQLFLETWADSLSDSTIDVSESKNSIRILTIHRSKGLAFPVVIMPFANWQLDESSSYFARKIIWAKPESDEFNHLPVYPVTYDSKLKVSFFEQSYKKEKLYNLMDSLNVLYVAFTRPIHQLIVFTTKKKTKNSLTTIGDALLSAVTSSDFLKEVEPGVFVRDNNFVPGFEQRGQQSRIITLDNYNVKSWLDKTDIKLYSGNLVLPGNVRQAAERGSLMHDILSEVETLEDIPSIVSKYVANNLLPASSEASVVMLLQNMIQRAGAEQWFGSQWKVLNEAGIMLKETGDELRPDRIVYNDTQVVIIDFKFAKPDKKHHKQVAQYAGIVSQIFPDKEISAYLLYETGTLVQVKF